MGDRGWRRACALARGMGGERADLSPGAGIPLPLLAGGTPQPPSPSGKEDSRLLPPSFSRSFRGVAPAPAGEVKVARVGGGGRQRASAGLGLSLPSAPAGSRVSAAVGARPPRGRGRAGPAFSRRSGAARPACACALLLC